MKKVYIPTMDELNTIQKLTSNGSHTYRYLLAKVIETLMMELTLDPSKPTLDIVYDKFYEFPEIAYAIAKNYPQEIIGSEFAVNDVDLCKYLIDSIGTQDDSIKQLDDILKIFEEGAGMLENNLVVNSIANKLSQGLTTYPRYRFEYKENSTLDEIFSCQISDQSIFDSSIDSFLSIEPAYVYVMMQHKNLGDLRSSLSRSITEYIRRYGVSEHAGINYCRTSIVQTADPKIKKLIRCLEHHKKNYQ